ncbi:MAG: LamG domain-containing protein [Archangiaceae bacterium]|nr:LamG domain-containing protein [Archangiaceae bacterium]
MLLALTLTACVDFDDFTPCFKTANHDYRGEVLANEPGVYLRFADARGAKAADETAHFEGTFSSAGITYGAPGALKHDTNAAITLSGDTGVGVSMPKGFDFAGQQPFSIELWVQQTEKQGFGFGVDHENWAQSREGWVVLLGGLQGPSVGIERRGIAGGVNGSVVNGPELSLNEWHHVVFTYDGKTLASYVDGKVTGLNDTDKALAASEVPWFIGNCIGCGSSNGIIGSLDEVALYEHALPACSVAAHYASAQ